MADINRIHNYLDTILEYIEDLNSNDKKLYSKTRQSLSDIRDKCNTISKSLNELLDKDDSSNRSDSSNIKTEIYRAGRVLFNLYKLNLPSKDVHICFELLYTWYNARILNLHTSISSFRYNINQISNWISLIVISYSKHLHDGDSDEFVNNFISWCEDLKCDDGKDRKYPLPYEIFQLTKDFKPSNITITSLVLWDILWDNGLSKFADKPFKHIKLTRDDVKLISKNYNNHSLSLYDDYKTNPEVLEYTKLDYVGGDSNG